MDVITKTLKQGNATEAPSPFQQAFKCEFERMTCLAEGNKLSMDQGHGFFLGKEDDSAQEYEHINRKGQSGRD